MAASPTVADGDNVPPPENWDQHQQTREMTVDTVGDVEPPLNGAGAPNDDKGGDHSHLPDQQPTSEAVSAPEGSEGTPGAKQPDDTVNRGEKQIKVLVWSLCLFTAVIPPTLHPYWPACCICILHSCAAHCVQD